MLQKNEPEYKGDGTVERHHVEDVKNNPDKMTDPDNIELMEKEKHRVLHKKRKI